MDEGLNRLDQGGGDPEPQRVAPEKPVTLDYRSPGLGRPSPGAQLVTVLETSQETAELARIKLESEGIPATIAGGVLNAVHALVFPSVKLQVPDIDLERAKEILARPAAEDAEGEYADEAWRCPKCFRKEVDLLPLSPGMRKVRNTFLVLLAVVPAMRFLGAIIAEQEVTEFLRSIESTALLFLAPLLIVLGCVWLMAKRYKTCRHCGHQWEHGHGRSVSRS